MVVEDGKPVGVITRSDLLGFLSDGARGRRWQATEAVVPHWLTPILCVKFSVMLCMFVLGTSADPRLQWKATMTEQPPGPPPSGLPPPPGGYPPPPGGYPPPPPGGAIRRRPGGAGYPPPPMPRRLPAAAAGGGRVCAAAAGQRRSAQLPQEAYTPWFTRVVASLIDYIPVRRRSSGIGFGIMMASTRRRSCVADTAPSTTSATFCATAGIGARRGSVVQSPACCSSCAYRDLELRLPPGHDRVEHRQVDHEVQGGQRDAPDSRSVSGCRSCASSPTVVDAIICYIGYLFPLWDPKRQTLADKIMTTVCLPT